MKNLTGPHSLARLVVFVRIHLLSFSGRTDSNLMLLCERELNTPNSCGAANNGHHHRAEPSWAEPAAARGSPQVTEARLQQTLSGGPPWRPRPSVTERVNLTCKTELLDEPVERLRRRGTQLYPSFALHMDRLSFVIDSPENVS